MTKHVQVSFTFTRTVWIFKHIPLQSCIWSTWIPVLKYSVLIGEIHSYLKNSVSTFFLTYDYDYRQHTMSPVLTYPILKTKHNFSHHSTPSSQINHMHIYAFIDYNIDYLWFYWTRTLRHRLEHVQRLLHSLQCLGNVLTCFVIYPW